MSELVTATGICKCSMGTTPAPLKATSNQKVLAGGKPCMTIADAQPMSNVGPFGMCTSMANPQVAAATAAHLGVLSPQPCIPMPVGPWIPTKPKVLIGGKPCLASDSKCMCAYAGVVTVSFPGQVKAQAN
ncbi:MAG: DUF4280 domain-containing protein [Butyrivibrio sp.]|uniref:DUF4280 domain-containing protein n=1 Tax=Butyrivibrio sp. TaxID=28121 RepID=UPI001B19763D|nr:DUF4280 domain-containing protein [Butyrivibrio sp.]MBO6241263.1 DUF4280 domain-containing protein [Butyrivibrio sp.]